MIKMFNKNKSDGKYIIYLMRSRSKTNLDKHIITNNNLNLLSFSTYYNVNTDDVKLFDDKYISMERTIVKYSKKYNMFKFYYMKYDDFLLDINTKKYNL